MRGRERGHGKPSQARSRSLETLEHARRVFGNQYGAVGNQSGFVSMHEHSRTCTGCVPESPAKGKTRVTDPQLVACDTRSHTGSARADTHACVRETRVDDSAGDPGASRFKNLQRNDFLNWRVIADAGPEAVLLMIFFQRSHSPAMCRKPPRNDNRTGYCHSPGARAVQALLPLL